MLFGFRGFVVKDLRVHNFGLLRVLGFRFVAKTLGPKPQIV